MNTVLPLDTREMGQRLLARRRTLGLQQEEVAERAGRSRAYVSRLERGLVPSPKLQDLQAIAGALEVGLSAVTGHHNPNGEPRLGALRAELEWLFPDNADEVARRLVQVAKLAPVDQEFVLRGMRAHIAQSQQDAQT